MDHALTSAEQQLAADHADLVERALRSVHGVWKRTRRAFDPDDLRQAGHAALVEAVIAWRVAKDRWPSDFPSFAWQRVRGTIIRFSARNRFAVSVPGVDAFLRCGEDSPIRTAWRIEAFPDNIADDRCPATEEWLARREQLQAAVWQAVDRLQGIERMAAEMIARERLCISRASYRTGMNELRVRTGLDTLALYGIQRRVLATAAEIVSGCQARGGCMPRRISLTQAIKRLARFGERGRRAVLAVVGSFSGDKAVPAAVIAGARVLAPPLVRNSRAEVSQALGLPGDAVRRIEVSILSQVVRLLGIARAAA